MIEKRACKTLIEPKSTTNPLCLPFAQRGGPFFFPLYKGGWRGIIKGGRENGIKLSYQQKRFKKGIVFCSIWVKPLSREIKNLILLEKNVK